MKRVVPGAAGVAAWDQAHAEAMRNLRNADAFFLVTWADLDGGTAEVVVMAKDGGAAALEGILVGAMSIAVNAYEDEQEAA